MIDKWAQVLVHYSTGVQPGDRVMITGGVAAEPLLRAIYREVLRVGGLPTIVPTFPEWHGDLLANGNDEQLAYISPIDRFGRAEADVLIRVLADTNGRLPAAVTPQRSAAYTAARRELGATMVGRAAAGDLRWNLTMFPTAAIAQDADMATSDLAALLERMCLLDQPDPVAAWRELHDRQQQLIGWLTPRSEMHILAPDTDLRMSFGGRTWNNSDGKRNFPSGEIFTGPIETSAEGHIRFSFPVVTGGREISDIRLVFRGGKVVGASAGKNEAALIAALDTDPGARFLGEIAFGTNYGLERFTKQILLDEKIGGTVHMAIGNGYPDTGSVNTSAVHWDMIADIRKGGRVTVDGDDFLVDGRYLLWEKGRPT
ncbi:MAG TPA: aminopeptidase [Thermomicrobiales bacterium]|nr:aminopeptidase [Thermomicrobiales bacterium]HRA47859.1 aminopeptidase [Thermomicrobiales bacterium]